MESSSLRGKIQIASIYINSRFSLSWCVSVIQLFFATFDFKSGEHHMDVHEDSWDSFFCGGGDTVFQEDGLCFKFYHLLSLLHAMYSLRSYILWLRGRDPRALVYTDDDICAVESKEQWSIAMSIIVSNLDQAGFILNAQKSRPEQQQVGTWLGFTLDLHYGNPGRGEEDGGIC